MGAPEEPLSSSFVKDIVYSSVTKVDACIDTLPRYDRNGTDRNVRELRGLKIRGRLPSPSRATMREITVICADPVEARLGKLAARLRVEGIRVIPADSAARCLALTAKHQPVAVVLDSDLLRVDQENMAEYVTRLSASTTVFLAVEDPSDSDGQTPYVHAVVKRGAAEQIASLLRGGKR